jgi:hypothetical protein
LLRRLNTKPTLQDAHLCEKKQRRKKKGKKERKKNTTKNIAQKSSHENVVACLHTSASAANPKKQQPTKKKKKKLSQGKIKTPSTRPRPSQPTNAERLHFRSLLYLQRPVGKTKEK